MAAVRLLPFWDNFSGPSDREWSRHSVLSGGLSASCVRSCLRVASVAQCTVGLVPTRTHRSGGVPLSVDSAARASFYLLRAQRLESWRRQTTTTIR